jgi:16S rRNA processing protein RimM
MLPVWDDMAIVGRVARVHGLRGQVVVNPETDFPASRFQPGRVVYRARDGAAEPLRVASLRLHRGRPIVGFEGIDSIDQAEELAGLELRVPLESLEALPAGAFYHHDLVGCRVETRSGVLLGSVGRVEGDGGASRLVVATGGGDVLVPLAADICVAVDVGRKLIVIEPPEGLLELNRVGLRSEDRRSHRGAGRSHQSDGRPRNSDGRSHRVDQGSHKV